MPGPQRYRIRFSGQIKPKGWELVEGKAFMLLPSANGEPHYVPADPSWPRGAPSRIAKGDAELAILPDPAR